MYHALSHMLTGKISCHQLYLQPHTTNTHSGLDPESLIAGGRSNSNLVSISDSAQNTSRRRPLPQFQNMVKYRYNHFFFLNNFFAQQHCTNIKATTLSYYNSNSSVHLWAGLKSAILQKKRYGCWSHCKYLIDIPFHIEVRHSPLDSRSVCVCKNHHFYSHYSLCMVVLKILMVKNDYALV